jgi:hypothetical protein
MPICLARSIGGCAVSANYEVSIWKNGDLVAGERVVDAQKGDLEAAITAVLEAARKAHPDAMWDCDIKIRQAA